MRSLDTVGNQHARGILDPLLASLEGCLQRQHLVTFQAFPKRLTRCHASHLFAVDECVEQQAFVVDVVRLFLFELDLDRKSVV